MKRLPNGLVSIREIHIIFVHQDVKRSLTLIRNNSYKLKQQKKKASVETLIVREYRISDTGVYYVKKNY